MWKYKVGQMVQLKVPRWGYTLPKYREYTGATTTITKLLRRGSRYIYELDLPSVLPGVGLKADEESLIPINPPATGSWTEIAALLGTDIRRLRETVR